jgi:hypothetical protein
MKKILLFLLITSYSWSVAHNPYYIGGSYHYETVEYYYIEDVKTSNCDTYPSSWYAWMSQHPHIKSIYSILTYSPGGQCAHRVGAINVADSCPNPGETFNPDTMECSPPPCGDNQTWNSDNEQCECNSPYVPQYNLSNDMSCVLPDCPPIYTGGATPLPLFKQTTDVNNCNFFNWADGAVLDIDGLVCCYGQEGVDDTNTCPPNTINIEGHCYPISEGNQTDEDIEKDICNSTPGMMWSINRNECVSIHTGLPENNETNPNEGNGGIPGSDGSVDGNGTVLGNTLMTEGNEEAFNVDMDGVKNSLNGLLDSYVFIKVPVNVSGSCSSELSYTFSFPLIGSYTVDASPYIAQLEPYMDVFRMLIYFLFAFSGVIIVLASTKE